MDHGDEITSFSDCPPITIGDSGKVVAYTDGLGRSQTPGGDVVAPCGTANNSIGHGGGACCDLCTGECVDVGTESECEFPRVFTPGATCADVACDPVICDDQNACTTEACNPATGLCETTSTVQCDDPVCNECDTETGECVPKDPPPPECSGGCLHRTPGFWGTHPHITLLFLPLSNCGLEINTTCAVGGSCLDKESAEDCSAPPLGSSAEEMCSSRRDARTNETSPQQLQLIRQCMAAELNMTASVELGGSCESETIESELIGSIMDRCCRDEGSVCRGETCGQEISESRCIEVLDAFNNSQDTLPLQDPFIEPGPALPCDCRAANGNGEVNPGRSLGAPKCANTGG